MEFEMTKVRVGKIVTGKVFHVADDYAYVDIQAFAEGIIYKEGLSLDGSLKSCKDVLKEGDELTFKITRIDHESQQILLTRRDMLREEKRAEFAQKAEHERIKVKVKKVTKGGLVCMYDGIEMFMPLSHIDVKRVNAQDFKGKTLECIVLESSERRIIVSRKVLLQEDERKAKEEAYEGIEVGKSYKGTVTSVLPYGAFVSFGNIEGLLHVSEISHHRVNDPNEVLKKGEEVEVKVIKKDGGKLSLSMKALLSTPWELFLEEHKVGDEVEGVIVRKMKDAMLIEVAKGVVGRLSSKDYSWDPNEHFAGSVEVSDTVKVKILSFDKKRRRMTLSRKHLFYNPWADVTVKKGETVSGTVVELKEKGAVVQVGNVQAFLPINEISTERIEKVADALKVEQVINALVLEVDKRKWNMKLSIKALQQKKERELFEQYKQEEQQATKQTLGELFKEKFAELKEDKDK
jgi:small subunit ribosomal protein S1